MSDSISTTKAAIYEELRKLDFQRGALVAALRTLGDRGVAVTTTDKAKANGHGRTRRQLGPQGSLTVDVLAALGSVESMRHKDIVARVGRNPSMALNTLMARGQVERVGVGRYRLIRATHVEPAQSAPEQAAIQ